MQLRMLGELRRVDGGMAGVRHVVHLVKAVGEEVVLVAETLLEDAEELGAELALGNLVQVPQGPQGAPAQKHGAEDVRLAPVNDLAELVPVVDVLKRHVLHGGAGHNEAVIELVAEGVESVVELNQVVGAHVGGLVAGDAHEVAAHLQRRLGDEAQNLGLGLHLGGHEVQDGHAQRADLLGLGDLLLQGKDALLVQDLLGGKSVGNVDGHGAGYLSGAASEANGAAPPPDAPVGPPPASSYSLPSIASRPGVLSDRE